MSIGELELDVIASETGFSGVIRVDRGDRVEIVKAYGLAHRSYDIPNEVDTRFALASGTKGLTALTRVAEMVRPRSDVSSRSRRYGLGFWLHASADAVLLTGMDAGVSFSSMHEPQSSVTRTVISNTSRGTWPVASYLDDRLVF